MASTAPPASRAGDIDQPDNRALRAAYELQAPIVYFHATAPGYYNPLFPWFVDADDPVEREVHVTPGQVIDLGAGPTPTQIDDPIERQHSHEYWQLSEPHQRNDGSSMVEDGENEEVDAVRALIAKLGRARSTPAR